MADNKKVYLAKIKINVRIWLSLQVYLQLE